jgi:hypothetical protein
VELVSRCKFGGIGETRDRRNRAQSRQRPDGPDGIPLLQKRAIVARVILREPAFVKRLLIGAGHEFDRLDRLLGIEHDRFSIRLDFFAAP